MSPTNRSASGQPLTPGVHTVTLDGLTLRYHVAGQGPVCIMHPGGPGAGWEYIRMPLVERDVTAVYLEPVGTGASTRLANDTDYALNLYTRCLRGLIERLQTMPVHVLGHSHGGFVALRLAIDHPNLVAGLVLFDTAARTGQEWFNEVMSNVAAFAERHADRADLGDILAALEEEATAATDEEATSVFRRQLPIYVADYWAREDEFEPLKANLTYHAGPNRGVDPVAYDLRSQLESITAPALVIAGRHDPILGPRWAQELHAGIEGSKLVVLENSGHLGHVEEPEAFAAAVSQFVRQTAPTGRNAQ